MSDEIKIIVSTKHLQELIKKYPSSKNVINKGVEYWGEKFNKDFDDNVSAMSKDVTLYERMNGRVHLPEIKDFLYFINTTEENEREVKYLLNSQVLTHVKNILMKYIDTSRENIEILAHWILGTYFHSEFETFPLLQLNSQKRSGKTRTLKLLSSLSFGSDGSVSTSPTETLLFRHKEGAMFFDEMENISSKERGAFRETLNAVYKRGNKIVRYKEKSIEGTREYVEEAFFPYYPLALANINGVGDVLADRSLQIILKRSSKQLTKLVEDFNTNSEIKNLKEELGNLYAKIPQDFFSKWNDYIENKYKDQELFPLFEKINETKIYGRSLEIFFPLFIIAYLCDNTKSFLKMAQEYVEKREEEEQMDDIDERLKNYVSTRDDGLRDFIGISSILAGFRSALEEPESWVNSRWLGRALKRLDLIHKKRLINGKTEVILKRNSTNATNTTNSTNSTNSTKEVESVEFVGLIDTRRGVDIVNE